MKQRNHWQGKRIKKGILLLIMISLVLAQAGCVKIERAGGKDAQEGNARESDSQGNNNAKGQAANALKARAQDDFYAYVNGEALSKTKLSYGKAFGGPIQEMDEAIKEEIYAAVIAVGHSEVEYPEGSAQALVRAVWRQYLEYLDEKETRTGKNEGIGEKADTEKNEDAREKAGVGKSEGVAAKAGTEKHGEADANNPVENALARIRDAASATALLEVIGDLEEEIGWMPFFRISVSKDYYVAGENALYLEQKLETCGISFEEILEEDGPRKQLLDMAIDALVSCGDVPEKAREKAKTFVYLILDVCMATDLSLQYESDLLGCYQFVKEEEMTGILGGLDVNVIERLNGMTKPNPYGGFYVADDTQLTALGKCFCEDNLDALKTWMTCELLCTYRTFLVEEHPFLKLYESGSFDENERLAAQYVNGILAEQVSVLYEEAYYTQEMDAFLDRLFGDVKESYRELIGDAQWLSAKTRQGLLQKLENLRFQKPGGASVPMIRVSDALGSTALETACHLKRIRRQQELEGIGKPKDENALLMPMQEMNACYSPDNVFTVSVAILHAPYFDPKASYEANLGGIGMVMAHEIGHAFDSNGFKFTAKGEYDPDWISETDREVLREREIQMTEYFDACVIMDVYHVDGTLTLGENFADKGAMECMMNVVKGKKERESLFENYAKIWCLWKEDAAGIDQLLKDEHSPERVRVNAVLSATNAFYEIYEVKEGDGMYVAPERRAYRWGSY
ncbi:MAG: M13 family metallopeptidase [Acetatifactor sp.]|nr:M13 family metallopeptidase [Acetatifactor sp.]